MMRLALIGVGKWGRNYITTARGIKNCRITHLCTKTPETLAAFPNSYKKTTRYQDLLERKDIDGVIIATPAVTHFSLSREFVKKGIPVLVEKPFTTNLRDAFIVEKLARKHKTLVMVGHEYLYNPAYLKLKKLIPQVGKINFISCEAGNWGPFRQDVSTLWDWGPHDVAMLIDLLGKSPDAVMAWGVGNDVVNARLNFKLTTTFVKLSRRLSQKVRQLIIAGEKKSLLYDELAKKKLALYGDGITNINYAKNSPLEREITAFILAIRTRRQPRTNLTHAVNVTRVLDAIERSLKENQPVILD